MSKSHFRHKRILHTQRDKVSYGEDAHWSQLQCNERTDRLSKFYPTCKFIQLSIYLSFYHKLEYYKSLQNFDTLINGEFLFFSLSLSLSVSPSLSLCLSLSLSLSPSLFLSLSFLLFYLYTINYLVVNKGKRRVFLKNKKFMFLKLHFSGVWLTIRMWNQ